MEIYCNPPILALIKKNSSSGVTIQAYAATGYNFRINEPNFTFGLMNPISFLDQWALYNFWINEPSELMNTQYPFRINEPFTNKPLFIFGWTKSSDSRYEPL